MESAHVRHERHVPSRGYVPMTEQWFAQCPGSEHEVVDRWIGGEVPGYIW